jgi:hypothetical protein
VRRQKTIPFDRLGQLQRLVVLERRREVEEACADTKHRESTVQRSHEQLRGAEDRYAEVHAGATVCLSQMALAAAIVAKCDDEVCGALRALDKARAVEGDAGSAWLLARHRVDWFDLRARDQRRVEHARSDDRVEAEARTLSLAVRPGANS